MGQRRKHVTQTVFNQDVQPPSSNQQIVRALGTRGGNIVEVEYPNGSSTLCMMPAKFNRKLWVRRGGFLIIEPSPEAEQDAVSRVTGTICAVLYDEHVKQLKKMAGVWPVEFAKSAMPVAATAATTSDEDADADADEDEDDDNDDDNPEPGDAGADTTPQQEAVAQDQEATAAAPDMRSSRHHAHAAAAGAQQPADDLQEDEEPEDDDDGLPPLQQINNRRVVYYQPSASESEEED